MYRYTFTAGTDFDTRGQAIADDVREVALVAIRAQLAQSFAGYTETDTRGGWMNPKTRELVTEAGKRWVVVSGDGAAHPGDGLDIGERMAGYIAAVLNQSTVLLEREEIAAQFVAQPVPERILPQLAA